MLILDMKQIPIIKPLPQITCTNLYSRFIRLLFGGPARHPSGGFTRHLPGGPARRPFYPPSLWRIGGVFQEKVTAVKRSAHQSLSVTPVEPHGKPVAKISFADSLRERQALP
jgi:hypothetical protein